MKVIMKQRLNSSTESVRQQIVNGEIDDQDVIQFGFIDPLVTQIVKDLSDVFAKFMIKSSFTSTCGTEIIVPMMDTTVLLSYLISYLDVFIQDELKIRTMAKSFFETEVFEVNEEIDQDLYNAVLNEITLLMKYLVDKFITNEADHHAPHSYDLVRILPANGLLLIRAGYRSRHF
jgi:hypothetical protein